MTPALQSTAAVQLPEYVASLAWRPDSTMLAAACADGSVHEILPDGGASAPAAHHHGGACAVDYAPDGTMASAGEDGRVAVGPRPPQPAGAGWVELLTWAPDGALLATAVGPRVQLWSADGDLVAESAALPATVECLAWAPDGARLAAGAHGGVTLLDRDGQPAGEPLEWTGVVLAVMFSPDGGRLACGMQDLATWVWDLAAGRPATITGFARKVRELAWSADGTLLAMGGGSTPLVVQVGAGIQSTGHVELRSHEGPVSWCGFQPGGDLLATAGADGLAILWSPPGESPLTGATIGESVAAARWSPDGTRLALAGETGRVAVFGLV